MFYAYNQPSTQNRPGQGHFCNIDKVTFEEKTNEKPVLNQMNQDFAL